MADGIKVSKQPTLRSEDVESKTNKMTLVWSRQHKEYKTKWSHSCQPRWPPVSHDTLVQEGNYLSQSRHIWQGDTPKISSHMIRTAASPEWDHPQLAPGQIPNCHKGCQEINQETQKGGIHHFQGIAEADSRPLLRQLSSTHQSAAPCPADLPWLWLPEALPCWTEDFICPAAHLALAILPCKTVITPLLTVLSPGPTDLDSGTWVHYSPLIALCVCYISFQLLECEWDINVC